MRSGFSLRSCLARSLRPWPASLGRSPHFPTHTSGRRPRPQSAGNSPAHAAPLEKDQPPFLLVQDALSKRADLFHRLRTVLRLEEKNPTAKKFDQIRAALQRFKASLRRKRPERGPAKDMREAIDLILTHLDRHGLIFGDTPRDSPAGRRRDPPGGPHQQWFGVSVPHDQAR